MKKLLIVIDYQNDFVNGSLGFPKAESLDNLIYQKIFEYKFNNNDVIYTFDSHNDNYLTTEEGKNLPVKHCIKGTNGYKLYGKVGSIFDPTMDLYFEKETFPSLDLANYLKNKDYDEIELCGLVSNICVLSNVIMVKSALPNAHIIVDHNLTASFDEELNDATLKILKGIHVEVR